MQLFEFFLLKFKSHPTIFFAEPGGATAPLDPPSSASGSNNDV